MNQSTLARETLPFFMGAWLAQAQTDGLSPSTPQVYTVLAHAQDVTHIIVERTLWVSYSTPPLPVDPYTVVLWIDPALPNIYKSTNWRDLIPRWDLQTVYATLFDEYASGSSIPFGYNPDGSPQLDADAVVGGAFPWGTGTPPPPIPFTPGILPFYGVDLLSTPKNADLVLGLAGRGTTGDLTALFTLNSGAPGSDLTMFYAYPQSYGLARFQDTSNPGFFVGWDAATGDPSAGSTGPLSLNVTIAGVIVPFYLYQTDNTGLGSINWQAMH